MCELALEAEKPVRNIISFFAISSHIPSYRGRKSILPVLWRVLFRSILLNRPNWHLSPGVIPLNSSSDLMTNFSLLSVKVVRLMDLPRRQTVSSICQSHQQTVFSVFASQSRTRRNERCLWFCHTFQCSNP